MRVRAHKINLNGCHQQKHTGLVALLDEESSRPAGTDATLLEKFHTHQKHPHYIFTKQAVMSSFGVVHYAGNVRPVVRRMTLPPRRSPVSRVRVRHGCFSCDHAGHVRHSRLLAQEPRRAQPRRGQHVCPVQEPAADAVLPTGRGACGHARRQADRQDAQKGAASDVCRQSVSGACPPPPAGTCADVYAM